MRAFGLLLGLLILGGCGGDADVVAAPKGDKPPEVKPEGEALNSRRALEQGE